MATATELSTHGLPIRTQAPASWQFINITKPTESRGATFRKIVRENAARDHPRKQRWSRMQKRATARLILQTEVPPPIVPLNDRLMEEDYSVPSGYDDGNSDVGSAGDFLPDNSDMGSADESLPENAGDESYLQSNFTYRETTLASKPRLQEPTNFPLKYPDLSQAGRTGNLDSTEGRYKNIGDSWSLETYLGAGMVDPFGVYPCRAYSQSHRLISHFVSVFLPGFGYSTPAIHTMTQYALAEPALFQATLSLAAVHIDNLYGKPEGVAALRHRREAIALLNQRMRSEEQAVADSTMIVVAFLAANETLLGNLPSWAIHMNALQRMVRLRGGPQNLGMEGLLNSVIACLYRHNPLPKGNRIRAYAEFYYDPPQKGHFSYDILSGAPV